MIDTGNELNRTGAVILDAAIHVHRCLGPGLLEAAYGKALEIVLRKRGQQVRAEVPITYMFEGVNLGNIFIMDLLVNDAVIVELKSVAALHPIHEAQLLTYLKLTNKKLGYLINFNVPLLKQGFRRLVHHF
ncbi:MAG: GxxExxY protein [Chitinophagaceae bacterium]|nr:MAG: GxxExxY protein [Chitinophagaceae bacterium]